MRVWPRSSASPCNEIKNLVAHGCHEIAARGSEVHHRGDRTLPGKGHDDYIACVATTTASVRLALWVGVRIAQLMSSTSTNTSSRSLSLNPQCSTPSGPQSAIPLDTPA